MTTLRAGVLLLLAAACGTPPEGAPPRLPPSEVKQAPLHGDAFVPTVSGHRLAVAGDVAAVVDPDGLGDDGARPMVYLVQISKEKVWSSVQLPSGANPQAVVLGQDGFAYVLAAGLGGVYGIEVSTGRIAAFVPTCEAPADLAVYRDGLVVACQSGEVVFLDPGAKNVLFVRAGLQRVTVAAGRVFVADSTATVFEVGPFVKSYLPSTVKLLSPVRPSRDAVPTTPRRLLSFADEVVMVYQQAIVGELTLPVDEPASPTGAPGAPASPYAGGSGGNLFCTTPAVRGAVAQLSSDGVGGLHFGPQRWSLTSLPVDGAISPDGRTLIIADFGGDRLEVVNRSALAADGAASDDCSSGLHPGGNNPVPFENPLGVEFSSDGKVLVLTASESLSVLLTRRDGDLLTTLTRVPLRRRHPSAGFSLFHEDPTTHSAPQGFFVPAVTCATCHPGGLSNGATTTVNGVVRRVMPLAGRMTNASLMHWEGRTFEEAVVEQTWRKNMAGRALDVAEVGSLRGYLDQLRLPARPRQEAARVEAGRVLFVQVGCARCHVPETGFTNDSVADVGHGLHKVPSLLGLAYTAPYMSDGCAPVLERRFSDLSCGGGDQHGHTSVLNIQGVTDLIAYLNSL